MIKFILSVFVALVLFRIFLQIYYSKYIQWETKNRHGLSYFGKTLAERRLFKNKIRKHAKILLPFIKLESEIQKKTFKMPSLEYEGTCWPAGTCSLGSFKAAAQYQPTSQDIFVVTFMKSGTTWMQQIVYEILLKGKGDLSDQGHGHLNAMSPWIESEEGVSVSEAPLLDGSKRLIKTHLPVRLCPYNAEAKYIYLVRDPVQCFASIADFFETMTGFLSPSTEELANWFCSDKMWWGPWPEHVQSWEALSKEKDNVLFLRFEDMKNDLKSAVVKVSQFLEVNLEPSELEMVVKKSSFSWMKEREELFEMSPPNLYSVSKTFFRSGEIRRDAGIPDVLRKKILAYCINHNTYKS